MLNTVKAEGYQNYFLPIKEVQELDQWLVNRYSIDCFESKAAANAARGRGAAHSEITKVDKLYDKISKLERRNKLTPFHISLELTNLLADEPWRGWWHSLRRAWTIDSISIACSIVKEIGKDGVCENILDVGCNLGFLPCYLAEKYKLNITGSDVARNAIAVAKMLDVHSGVNFIEGPIDALPSKEGWHFVVAVDLVQPQEHDFTLMMTTLAGFVRPNGHLLVIGNFVDERTFEFVIDLYRKLGFSCLRSQLTGGFQQGHAVSHEVDWSAKCAMHFQKTVGIDIVKSYMLGNWNDFAEYANSGEHPFRQLNHSYFLARQAAQSQHSP